MMKDVAPHGDATEQAVSLSLAGPALLYLSIEVVEELICLVGKPVVFALFLLEDAL